MGNQSFLDDYLLPDGAREDLMAAGATLRALDGDPRVQVMAGHDRGLAFRFVEIAVKNEMASKAAKYAVFDKVEIIEWLKSKRARPTEQIRFLPPELLHIDPETKEVTGRFANAYKRWKEGLTAPGLPLSKWGVLDVADLATLVGAGIFSVEQFASLPRNRVEGRYRASILEAFEDAILYTRRQQGLVSSDEMARKIVELEARLAKAEAKAEGDAQVTKPRKVAGKAKRAVSKNVKLEGVKTPGVQEDGSTD